MSASRPAPLPATRAAPSTLRLVVRRAIADRLVTLPAWLLVVGAVTLLVASVLHADVARRDGLLRALRAMPASELAVVVRATLYPALARLELDGVAGVVAEALDGTGAAVRSMVRSDSYAPDGQGEVTQLTRLVDADAAMGGADLVDGRWPEAGADPLEAVVAQAGAAALGLRTGDTLALTRRTDDAPLRVTIVGLVALRDEDDARWLGEPLLVTGRAEGDRFTTVGPLIAAREDVLERGVAGSIGASWVGIPDPAAVEQTELRTTAARVRGLAGRLEGAVGVGRAEVQSTLPEALDRVGGSLLAGGAGTILLSAQLAVLAAYGLVLIAGLLVDERRPEAALFRSRGANGLHLARWSVAEGAVLVASAAVAGLALAVALIAVAPRLGVLGDASTPLPAVDLPVVAVTVAAAVAGLGAFLLPTLTSLGPLATARRALGRQGPRGLAQRAGLDLALLLLAGLGLWQLREYGAPVTRDVRGSLGVDPLLVAAPAVALLAGAVLALRIVPLAAALAERAVGRSRGLLLPLGARQLARRPGRYARTALLLVMASAVSLFGGAYAATWERSQADQVDQELGADLRVSIADGRAEAWAVDAALAGIAGVGDATPVRDEGFDLGTSGRGTLLAVRPEASSILRIRADRAAEPIGGLLAAMAAARPPTAGLVLPDGTAAIRVVLSADLEPWLTDDQPARLNKAYPGLSAAAVVRDAGGLVARFDSPRVDLFAGPKPVRIALSADGLAPRGPLELLAIELVVQLPDATAAVGGVRLREVGTATDPAADPAGAGAWRPLDAPPFGDWATTRQARDADPELVPPREAGRIEIPEDAPLTGPVPAWFGFRVPTLGAAKDPLEVPALVDPGVRSALGAGPGDTVTIGDRFASPRRLRLVGTLSGLPTVPAGRPFVLADLPTLALSDYLAHGETSRAEAWWLGLADPADEAAVTDAVEALPFRADAASRAALLADRLADPVTRAVLATLGMGALAALGFAAIGFLVTAVVGTRERLPEVAVLRALGTTRRRLGTWLAAEQALLLLAGLGLGAVLGAALGWVVLPSVTLSPTAQAVDPPPLVVVPWERLAVLAVAGLAMLAVTAAATTRLLRGGDVPAVLRAGDG